MIHDNLLSIIIPVFNERRTFSRLMIEIEEHVTIPHEIIVVYDFDYDDSLSIARKLHSKLPSVVLVKNTKGVGIINAVLTGFENSHGSIVVIMAADFADDPKTIPLMHEKIKKGYDIVCATRYADGGKRLNQMSFKVLLSHAVGLSTPWILGIPITDLTNGFKMYRRSVLEKIKIESNGGWEFAMEIIIKAQHKGCKITDVPTISKKRKYGQSKFKLFKWLPKYIYWYAWGVKKRFL